MDCPSQTDRQTGPHRSLLCPNSHHETCPAQKNGRPETKQTMLLVLLKTHQLQVPPPFSDYFFFFIIRGIPGSRNNNASIFHCCKAFYSSVYRTVFVVVCSPLSYRLFPCALVCLSGNSPVTKLPSFSVAADSVGLSLRDTVYGVNQQLICCWIN